MTIVVSKDTEGLFRHKVTFPEGVTFYADVPKPTGEGSAPDPHAYFVGGGVVEASRVIKSPQEIAYIKQAAGTAVKGMEAGIRAIKPGKNEPSLGALGCFITPRSSPFWR